MEVTKAKLPNKNKVPMKTARVILATIAFLLAGCEVIGGVRDVWGIISSPPTLAPRIFTDQNCNDIQPRDGVVAISSEEYERAKKSLKEMFINHETALGCIEEKRPVATFTPVPTATR